LAAITYTFSGAAEIQFMNKGSAITISHAVQDFRSARQQATLREIIARLTGSSTELLSYDEVRQKLRAQAGSASELKDIPIDAIIGSVNRYQDFSRGFLPGKNINEERWANIERANYASEGLPPVEVYQIDQAYFVSDGNHRVSVAKQLGSTHIQAYVTQVQTRVPLTPDVRPEDLILKSEYTDFLVHTNLDQVRPVADLSVTEPGQYQLLEEHIRVHRYYMGLEQQRDISVSEAAADWYDVVYTPVIEIVRERGLLIDFPSRTEADLYLWIADHRALLEEELKGEVEVISAANDLADQYSQRPYRVIARIGNRIVRTFVPSFLNAGPATGEWRQTIVSARNSDRLFSEILVPINGREDGWYALEQAFVFAGREEANLHGLYIVDSETEQASQVVSDLQKEFTDRCLSARINGDLSIKVGDITSNICDLARWNDLVIMNLAYPPEPSMFARLSSGIRNLVQRCPRPIMFTPTTIVPMHRALSAYDGSLKAQEALFIAAYIAAKWSIPLSVISIGDEADTRDIQYDANQYMELHNIHADYVQANGVNNTDVILQYVDKLNVDLLLIGGYSRNPVLEVLQGGDVDELLRQTRIPLIICR
jgi:nucleotide-binding universal stress UspA family protein